MAKDEAYYAAEKKIQQALQSGATELDLREMGLTELPESFGRLTHLLKLNVGGDSWKDEKNQLTQLPDSLWKLTRLQSVDFSSNKLSALPHSLGQLTQLTNLNLSSNQLTTLPDSLGQLTQLTSLNLSDNQLTTLPDSLGQLTQLTSLNLSDNQLTALPPSLGQLTQLTELRLSDNQLTALPESIGYLMRLCNLFINDNPLTTLPNSFKNLTLQNFGVGSKGSGNLSSDLFIIGRIKTLWIQDLDLEIIPDWLEKFETLEQLWVDNNLLSDLPETLRKLKNLKTLVLGQNVDRGNPLKTIPLCVRSLNKLETLMMSGCQLESLPEWIEELSHIRGLRLDSNALTNLPLSLVQLEHLETLDLDDNPLNPELAEAYKQGIDDVRAYLRAKSKAQIILNEAKLILVGEGEVGKTCLMDALLDKPWQEHPSTHGIEIQQVKVTDPATKKQITLNGWDFGGQRVYRPTHQLFFSAPAVYLVVWKPREGPQQGFVKEWIQLVKRREPTAKIIVVATHGGPQQRQPDIDRQELWDLFGRETVADFFWVDSKPDKHGNRKNIEELKLAIAHVTATLPEVGRSVPKSFQDARKNLQEMNVPYLALQEVISICLANKMDEEIANLFITISHRLGHLTHYKNDPALRDIVILRPDWLATAMSYVLDDEETRKAHGLVRFSRLGELWKDSSRNIETRYPEYLHRVFLRLMERFDLSYRVAGISSKDEDDPISLIAQLVPDNRPENDVVKEWPPTLASGDAQQIQICRIVDDKGQSANAEGLFYQLIVRLHKYSLGRVKYDNSIHWQRGLILDDDYNGRAMLEHIGNDVRITVRAPYPERFLAMLTAEVKYLVESFWEGLNCDVMVPCIDPCGKKAAGTGLYQVEKLIDSKKKGRPEFPCPVCNEWQDIDCLLRNAPAAQPISLDELLNEFAKIKDNLDEVTVNTRRILSQIDKNYADLLQVLTDEAKEGPRLFSFVPVDRKIFNPKEWTSAKFRLTLWCEHSRLPLPAINGKASNEGVYEIELTREWFKKTAPYLKVLAGTLSMVLPVALSGVKLEVDNKAFEEQLDFGKDVIDASLEGGEKIGGWLSGKDTTSLEHGEVMRAEDGKLRELHTILKQKDPSFGGLKRVLNKRQEFLWVHEKFASEY